MQIELTERELEDVSMALHEAAELRLDSARRLEGEDTQSGGPSKRVADDLRRYAARLEHLSSLLENGGDNA